MKYQTARLIKGRRTFLFVWEDDQEFMTVVEYLRGQKVRGHFRARVSARGQWLRLLAAGYLPGKISREGINQIPASLY